MLIASPDETTVCHKLKIVRMRLGRVERGLSEFRGEQV
jgi:hypothetical protein